MFNNVIRIARKEVATFYSSPLAFIFLGAFLATTLFVFFWVETFFARNIADIRPLFEWMPVLLIFLIAALTMKMWADEKRMGTLEFLLTQPVEPLHFVLGKFFACMMLVAMALLLTLPIPITVSILGNLDWGPVFGAYLATLFLAAAYTSIGLTVSSKSDNQIVSLIMTALVCTVFYVFGSDSITSLFGNQLGEFFKSLGTGSRFTSITRGVIDARDLYYYLSIVGIFIALNVYFLESGRWAKETKSNKHLRWRIVVTLFVANCIVGNVWLSRVAWARADFTEGHIYSISDATRNYLKQLREPLLLRGYFSAKTHPLLAPLVPQLRDLMLEYEVAGNGRVRTEFIDPLENPELEVEAGQKYGIKPVPFQVADKYQAALINSYFDVLIQYGDQYLVLGFRDLIEIKSQTEGQLDVELKNPEYEITRSIKKVLYEYQSTGDLFANLGYDLEYTGYVSPDDRLPPVLIEFKANMNDLLQELQSSSKGRFKYKFEEPEANVGAVAKKIGEKFGFRPMRAGLLDPTTFYFYMVLTGNDQAIQVPLPEDLNKESLRRSIEAALKRFASGFMKTIALYTPPLIPPDPSMRQFRMPSGKRFQLLDEKLTENHNVKPVKLDSGFVPDEADLLLLVAPDKFDQKQLFALDQFLMKGGTVILSTSSFRASLEQGNLSVTSHYSGINDWLAYQGISIEDTLVLDPQNAMLPIPINRNLGGFTVQEIRMVEYPYFVDVRHEGMKDGGAITTTLPQITLNWASPINIDAEKNRARQVNTLFRSSAGSWTSDSLSVLPDFDVHGPLGFEVADQQKSVTLAVSVEGQFESFFKGKDSPLLKAAPEQEKDGGSKSGNAEGESVFSNIIEKSPRSARIILVASNEFLTDQTLQLAASAGGSQYLNSVDFIENAVDWSLEDRGLLSIRSRGHFSRTLLPLDSQAQVLWEYLNYIVVLFGLFVIYILHRRSRAKAKMHYQDILQHEEVNA